MMTARLNRLHALALCAVLALGSGQAWGSEGTKSETTAPKVSPWSQFDKLPYEVTRQVTVSLVVIGLSFVGKTVWDYCTTPGANTPLLRAKQYSDYLENPRSPEVRLTLLTKLHSEIANIKHLNSEESGLFLALIARAKKYDNTITADFLDAKFCELNKVTEPKAFIEHQKKLATLKQATEDQKNKAPQKNTENVTAQNLKTLAKGQSC